MKMLTFIFICSLLGCSSVPVVPRLPVPEPAPLPLVNPKDITCIPDHSMAAKEKGVKCKAYIITVEGIKVLILRERLLMNDFETCQNIIKENNKHAK